MKNNRFTSSDYLKILFMVIIIGTIFVTGCTDIGLVNYHSSAIDANFEAHNLTLTDVRTLASQSYSVEEIIPTEGIAYEDIEILDSQFGTGYTVYLVKIVVPHDKKMSADEYPEQFTLFVHQKDTDIGWNPLPRNNNSYSQEYVAGMVKLSFNVSDKEADQYAEMLGEKVTGNTVSVPHQPDVQTMVDYLNERGNFSTNPLGNGNYRIDYYNESLPYTYKDAGNIFVHTGCLKITQNVENTRYEIIIDKQGILNVIISAGLDGVSPEDRKAVLQAIFENIGLDTGLVNELEFEESVV